MTRVTFDSKALKKVRDIYSKRANEVAKNIAPTVYNIEVTTEDSCLLYTSDAADD